MLDRFMHLPGDKPVLALGLSAYARCFCKYPVLVIQCLSIRPVSDLLAALSFHIFTRLFSIRV